MNITKSVLDEEVKIEISDIKILNNSSDEALLNFNVFQKQYITTKQVKIDLKDLVKREAKKAKKKQVEIEASNYSYIFDSDLKNIPSIVHKFILDNKEVDIPVSTIEKYIKKYLE